MLAASECGFIIDPDRIEGQFEDFIGVYRRFVHHDICAAIVKNFDTYIDINPEIVQYGKDQMPDKKLARHDVSIMLDDVDMGLATHFYKYLNSAFGNYKQEYDHLKTNLNSISVPGIQKSDLFDFPKILRKKSGNPIIVAGNSLRNPVEGHTD